MKSKQTRIEVKKIISRLAKESNKRKEKLWKDLAERINKPRRNIAKTNIWKIEKIAKKNKDKVIVVPGKVLSEGQLTQKVEIAALDFSGKAKEKIISMKGNALSLNELLDKKIEAKKIIIVK